MSGHPLESTVYEVQILRQELAESRKKLQDYADTIVSLHGELRTLRDNVCKSCKRKFVPATRNLVSSQAAEPAVDSSALVESSRALAETTNSIPPISEIPVLPPPILSTPTHIPSPPPIVPTKSTSNPVTTTPPSKVITPETVPCVPRWAAEQDENAAVNVTFVRAFSHKGQIRSVRFSADGKYLAAVGTPDGKNGSIFIYDVETGDKICELLEYASQYSTVEKPAINCMCFSPAGRYLVVGDFENRVIVWDIPTKGIRNQFKGHKSSVDYVDFSPNGRLVVSTSWDGAIFIWNMRDGSVKVFIDTIDFCYSTRFSPNGQFVAMGSSSGLVRIWNVRKGHLVRIWTGHHAMVRSVVFTPGGKELVTGGYEEVVKCWDLSSLENVQSGGDPMATMILECKGHSSIVNAVAVSHNAQWIAACFSDGRTIIWDTHSAAMRPCALIGHVEISSVDFSPVGDYLALGGRNSHTTLWRYT